MSKLGPVAEEIIEILNLKYRFHQLGLIGAFRVDFKIDEEEFCKDNAKSVAFDCLDAIQDNFIRTLDEKREQIRAIKE